MAVTMRVHRCVLILLLGMSSLPLASSSSSSPSESTSASVKTATVEVPLNSPTTTSIQRTTTSASSSQVFFNDTFATSLRNVKRNIERGPTLEQRDEEARRRRMRVHKRRAKARETLAKLSQRADTTPAEGATEAEKNGSTVHRLTKEEVDNVRRRTSWFGNSDSYSFNAALGYLADPTAEYDKWAQAYRMLGAFIDCDHQKSEGSGDNQNNNDGDADACSRWMMWAAYVNPNYQGYEYDEYFSDEPYSTLDCHNPDTEWQLVGVYRQEFYQFLEQISKHLWAIDDYEYIVARAGLMYMTDYDCFQVGNDNNGNAIRAGIQPEANGRFSMALYTDDFCLEPNENVGTYDDYVQQTDVDLGSKDQGDGQADDLYDWWYAAQEYTFEMLNDVYEEYMFCTPCMDYPTYQDGYFIGDYGTDDDDLINQCWKFHSHDSFICEGECIAMGHAQGSINQVLYGDKVFGTKLQASSYSEGSGKGNRADVLVESSWSRIMANAFLTFSFLLFVATFLAFAVARRSRYRESRSSKSRRLLDEGHDDDGGGGHRSVRSRRSRSRKKKRGTSGSRRSSSQRKRAQEEEGDGLFRTSDHDNSERENNHRSRSRSHRSKSRTGSKRGRSKSESKKRSSGSKSRSKDRNAASGGGPGAGDPPSNRSKSSRSQQVHEDNF